MPDDMNAPEGKIDQTWLIEPRSPLVFRTGRVGLHGSAGKEVFDFPVPGTVAGAVRAAYADANDWDFTQEGGNRRLVESIAVRGPLLASQSLQRSEVEVFFPKPIDAVYLNDPDAARESVCTAYPQERKPGEGCDLPYANLLPVVLDANALAKPLDDGPTFWNKSTMELWLRGADFISTPAQCGPVAPPTAVRTHVQMDRERRTYKDEGLFESAGIDFGPQAKRSRDEQHILKWEHRQYGLLVRTRVRANLTQGIDSRVGRVGADGRTGYFQASSAWPALPPDLGAALAKLKKGDRFRLILVTPAIFKQGWRPGWLEDSLTGTPPGLPGVCVKLIAATAFSASHRSPGCRPRGLCTRPLKP